MKALERGLTLSNVVAISISAMVGSGIFVLPGIASGLTGRSIWLAYLLAGLLALPAVLSKAELATAMPTSGGTYVYIERALGPLGGTVAGLGLWLSMLLKAAFALVGFGAYLVVVADVPLLPTSLTLLALIVGLNVVGVRKVGQAQVGVVALSLTGLAGLVIAGFLQAEGGPDAHDETFSGGASGLLAASGFVFVSYAGVTKVAAVAEEVKNPGRNLPLGMLLSLFIAMAVYVLVTLALVWNVPTVMLGDDLKPIHTLAETLGGPFVGVAAALLGIVTMTSMANSGLLAASRFPFAMSRDDLLPPAFRQVSERFATPVVSILATGVTIGFAILYLDVERMAKLASAAVILLYLTVNAAVLVFRETRVQWYSPTFRSPWYPFTQIVGIVGSLVLLGTMGLLPLIAVAAMLVLGILLYIPWGRTRARRLGVLLQRGRRRALLTEPRSLEDAIGGQAAVAVPLFGHERSPETLVELAGKLSGDRRTEVVQLTEVPEQTAIDAALEDDPKARSVERRVVAAAEEMSLEVTHHSLVTRDLVRTVHHVASHVGCEWLVMQWKGSSRTKLLPRNPLGWLINHLPTNLALFDDAGVRHFREILVYPEPGPNDALVVRTAARLAPAQATLTFARVVPEDAPEEAVEKERDYLRELRALVEVPTEVRVLRGKDRVKAIANATDAYDLLVMGVGDMSLLSSLRGGDFQRLTARAACSVLSLKTPQKKTHEAFDRHRDTARHGEFDLLGHLAPGCIAVSLEAKRKDALFDQFAATLVDQAPGTPSKTIVEGLWERERSQNTAVGDGVAMPHATIDVEGPTFGVFTTESPVDWDAPDGQSVDVFFVTIGPPTQRQSHLRILSGLAELCVKTSLLDQLRSAGSPEEVADAMRASVAEIDGMAAPVRRQALRS